MAVTIRPVGQGDRAVWQRLFTAYVAFYKLDLAPASAGAVWGWVHDPENPFWADLAVSAAGEAVGLVHHHLMHRSLGGSMTCVPVRPPCGARGARAGCRARDDRACARSRASARLARPALADRRKQRRGARAL